MRLELDDPSAARDLVSYLNARPDCVAAETARGVVEVNLLGSQRLPFMRLELDLRLGAWRAANPGVLYERFEDVGHNIPLIAPTRLAASLQRHWTTAARSAT